MSPKSIDKMLSSYVDKDLRFLGGSHIDQVLSRYAKTGTQYLGGSNPNALLIEQLRKSLEDSYNAADEKIKEAIRMAVTGGALRTPSQLKAHYSMRRKMRGGVENTAVGTFGTTIQGVVDEEDKPFIFGIGVDGKKDGEKDDYDEWVDEVFKMGKINKAKSLNWIMERIHDHKARLEKLLGDKSESKKSKAIYRRQRKRLVEIYEDVNRRLLEEDESETKYETDHDPGTPDESEAESEPEEPKKPAPKIRRITTKKSSEEPATTTTSSSEPSSTTTTQSMTPSEAAAAASTYKSVDEIQRALETIMKGKVRSLTAPKRLRLARDLYNETDEELRSKAFESGFLMPFLPGMKGKYDMTRDGAIKSLTLSKEDDDLDKLVDLTDWHEFMTVGLDLTPEIVEKSWNKEYKHPRDLEKDIESTRTVMKSLLDQHEANLDNLASNPNLPPEVVTETLEKAQEAITFMDNVSNLETSEIATETGVKDLTELVEEHVKDAQEAGADLESTTEQVSEQEEATTATTSKINDPVLIEYQKLFEDMQGVFIDNMNNDKISQPVDRFMKELDEIRKMYNGIVKPSIAQQKMYLDQLGMLEQKYLEAISDREELDNAGSDREEPDNIDPYEGYQEYDDIDNGQPLAIDDHIAQTEIARSGTGDVTNVQKYGDKTMVTTKGRNGQDYTISYTAPGANVNVFDDSSESEDDLQYHEPSESDEEPSRPSIPSTRRTMQPTRGATTAPTSSSRAKAIKKSLYADIDYEDDYEDEYLQPTRFNPPRPIVGSVQANKLRKEERDLIDARQRASDKGDTHGENRIIARLALIKRELRRLQRNKDETIQEPQTSYKGRSKKADLLTKALKKQVKKDESDKTVKVKNTNPGPKSSHNRKAKMIEPVLEEDVVIAKKKSKAKNVTPLKPKKRTKKALPTSDDDEPLKPAKRVKKTLPITDDDEPTKTKRTKTKRVPKEEVESEEEIVVEVKKATGKKLLKGVKKTDPYTTVSKVGSKPKPIIKKTTTKKPATSGSKTSKPKQKRAPNRWNMHMSKMRLAHPGMDFGELVQLAKKTYKK
jgi:hypothetical protein